MQYILTEEELSKLKATERDKPYLKKWEKSAKDYIAKNGCAAEKGGYCDDCPFADFISRKDHNYCIVDKYRDFSQ